MQLIDEKLDAMTEVVNIGIGRAAASLSDLVGERIELHVPRVRLLDIYNSDCLSETGLSVVQGFNGAVAGNAMLVFPSQSGRVLASLLAGGVAPEDLQPYEVSGILSEVGNIVLNGVLGSIANVMQANLSYEVPVFHLDQAVCDALGKVGDGQLLVADAALAVQSRRIDGKVLLAFDVGSVEAVLESLML